MITLLCIILALLAGIEARKPVLAFFFRELARAHRQTREARNEVNRLKRKYESNAHAR
jgi:cytochrome P450